MLPILPYLKWRSPIRCSDVVLIFNFVIAISIVDSFHPSAQQKQAAFMNVELDVERRLQALVAKDRVRIKEFFIDFDKLRKGWVGEAAVSINKQFSSSPARH